MRGVGIFDQVVAQQKQQRKDFLQENMNLRPLTALTAHSEPDTPDSYLAGWSGGPVEAWRITSRDIYWHHLVVVGGRALLTGEDSTFADWVGAYVHLSLMRRDRVGFTRFWVEDVELTSMRRHWVRWAVQIAQSSYKVGPGNPADEQHSTYLVDCDLFLSADARFIAALETVHTDAPFALAEPRLVSGDRDFLAIFGRGLLHICVKFQAAAFRRARSM